MASDSAAHSAVYLYEDDTALAEEIAAGLANEGLHVRRLASREELSACGLESDGHVLVMDRLIDGHDTIDVLAALRAKGSRISVLVISSLASVDERIRGLKAGGDDYLVKPFAMGELVARVEALQRRAPDDRRTRLVVGSLEMDLIARTVRRGSREITLLPREFVLLGYLMRHADHVVSRAMLLEDVWNYRMPVQTNVVDVHVGNLRRKVDAEGEPRLITSVRGVGFRLAAEKDAGS